MASLVDVHIPKLGMSTVEVDILEIYVAVGDQVEAGTALMSIEAEKAQVDIPAPVSGSIAELLATAGDEMEVGDVVARMTASQ